MCAALAEMRANENWGEGRGCLECLCLYAFHCCKHNPHAFIEILLLTPVLSSLSISLSLKTRLSQESSLIFCLSPSAFSAVCSEKKCLEMGMKREKEEGEKKKKKTKKGRSPCCAREGVTKGAWTPEEDKILVDFITENGHGTWRNLPQLAGLLRCGKSCRLRWTNYLRPDIKRGPFSPEEENTIIQLHGVLGNKWATIASHLQGRTDNDVKNFWNSHLRKRFDSKALTQPSSSSKSVYTKSGSSTFHTAQWESVRVEAESRFSAAPLPRGNSNSKGDYFLQLWNSEVGESFRSMNESANESTSQSSSLTKVESTNLSEPRKTSSTVEMKVEVWNCKKEPEDIAAFSDTSKSYEVDDSSDAMLKMLLDFPVGGNDMAFLEPPSLSLLPS